MIGALRCLRRRNFSPSKKGADDTKHWVEKMQNDFAMNDTYSRCAAVHSSPPSSNSNSSWQWNTFGQEYELVQGLHTLTVHQREDGTKLARVRIESGDAHFSGHSVHVHACRREV